MSNVTETHNDETDLLPRCCKRLRVRAGPHKHPVSDKTRSRAPTNRSGETSLTYRSMHARTSHGPNCSRTGGKTPHAQHSTAGPHSVMAVKSPRGKHTNNQNLKCCAPNARMFQRTLPTKRMATVLSKLRPHPVEHRFSPRTFTTT